MAAKRDEVRSSNGRHSPNKLGDENVPKAASVLIQFQLGPTKTRHSKNTLSLSLSSSSFVVIIDDDDDDVAHSMHTHTPIGAILTYYYLI